ncbi:MAG: LD-carboxypeptidase [Schwartzia sp.]|nr:LD-carboxypeptidase [Schwartzia sp. (in: firmicutes)]
MRFKKILAFLFAAIIGFSYIAGLSVSEAREKAAAGDTASLRRKASHRGKTPLRGAALRPGDCIGVLAPGFYDDKDDYAEATAILEAQGYRLKFAPSCTAREGYFAGPDSLRASDINRMFLDDEVKAIICLRGGYGAARLLDKLDYQAIADHPKALIGFSDATALHAALWEKCRLATIHGPVLCSLRKRNAYALQQFLAGISSAAPLGELKLPPGEKMRTVVAGEAEGVIIGGNLTVVASLAGTPYELKGDGALLLLEEDGEDSYRIDRMLNQLWQNGLLQRVNGILLGDFFDTDDDLAPGDYTTEEVLTYYANLCGKPVIKGVPSGHGSDNAFLPLGVHVVMRARPDGTASLVFDEAALTDSMKNRRKE